MAEHAQPDRRSKLTDAEAPGRAGVQLMLPADGRTAKNEAAAAAARARQDCYCKTARREASASAFEHCMECIALHVFISASVSRYQYCLSMTACIA